MTYFNGHIHTDMSNIRMLDSTNKVEPVIDYAIELGLAGIAITDHESIGNHIKAMLYLEGKKKKAKEILDSNPEDMEAKRILNFKLGLGNEIYLCRDGLSQKNYIKGEDGFFHFILIAKDKIGHHQIRLLTSRAWDRSFYQFIERVPTYYSDIEEIVGQNPGHLIATTACLGGYFPKLLLAGKDQIALNFLNWCKDIFGEENFFIEIQPGISQEQKLFNILALDFAKKNNFKITVATDAHYLKEEDRKVHKSFLNSGEGDREVDAFYATTYLMSPEETLEKLNYLPKKDLEEIFKTSLSISDKIEEYSLANKQIIPRIPLDFSSFKDRVFSYNNYPYITKFFESEYEEDVYFISSIFKKAQDLNILDKPHLDRLEKECEEIWIVSDKIEERLSAYFITVKKVIQLAWEEGDTLVGPWRGSVGSMLCAYLMDVIQRDPLKSPIELPYWRFCSRGRAELADVDIDTQASKREKFIAAVRKYFESIGGELTPVATFGTETSKAALQTAVRGLGYEPELGTYLSSLVLVDRGFVRSLKQCYYGDEEKGFSPISQFVIEMDNYPDVWEVAKGIEGLISRRGIHASGVILTNTPFTDLGATMRSPKGVKCSQWELHTEEYAGHIKYDFLTTDALDRIRTCLDLLLEYKYIEWQGSLKETYWKYLNPDILDYQDHDMWKLVGENKIISLFQFDTPQGLSTAKQIKPNSLLELAQANSLMRLMPEAGQMSPVEEFVKYKENPSLLKQDIYSLKATEKEKEILYNFMKTYGGVLDSQESLMLAVMIPEFTNYSVDEANKVRKVVAKKKMKEISKTREDFYQRGRANGVSEDILYYIWDVQAAKQMGYSFSIVHTIAYSIIAVQELNLAFKFPQIFWNTSCLIVDSAGIEDETEEEVPLVKEKEEEEIEDEEEEEEEVKKGKKTKVVKYGKISSAIGKVKTFGAKVSLPNINESYFTFRPNLKTNTIIYGIKGISRINDEYAYLIIKNRPYENFEDFLKKVKSTKLQIINLIKSGAFDCFGEDREHLLKRYICSIAGFKKKLTLQNMPTLINYNLIPEEYKKYQEIFNFNKYLKKECKQEAYYYLDEYSLNFFNKYFDLDLVQISDNGNSGLINQKVWEKIYKKEIEGIRPLINNPETLDRLNKTLFLEIWNKYCSGNIAKWEMDSIGFYNKEHELNGFNFPSFNIVDFTKLPEDPVPVKNFVSKDGKTINMFDLVNICGTILEKDKLKNLVTILTDFGVVKVKIFKSQFAKYDKQIFIKDEITGKKKVIEKSWFTRGNKIIFTGLRRGDFFIPKVYKNTPYSPLTLIDITDYKKKEYNLITERAM